MEKNAFLGELIYIGLVIEKCRCKSHGIWKIGYKRTLMIHLDILKKLAERLMYADVSKQDVDVLQEFFAVCKKNPEVGRFYNINPNILQKINQKDYGLITHVEDNSDMQINKLIIALLNEALFYLNASGVLNKEKIHMLIRSLHNLPIYYLKKGQSVNGSSRNPISKKSAIDSTFSIGNMDDETREKYKYLLI